MDVKLRKEIAKYLHESEKAILEAEGNCNLLKEEIAMCKVTIRNLNNESVEANLVAEGNCNLLKAKVAMCKVTIRNLNNEIKNLEETTLRQQAMLDEFTASDKLQQCKMKRHDTYSKKALGIAFGCSE
jgi:hypothetical protein